MRFKKSLPGIRWAVAIVLVAAFVFALAAPVIASAATRTTIRLSSTYMSKAKVVTISGVIRPKRAGKVVSIYILRPGMSKWSFIGTRTTNRLGRWSMRYRPRTSGKYRYRATYGTRTAAKLLRIRTAAATAVLVKSTTSTKDSGLWDAILPQFQHKYPQVGLSLSSVGSGQSITDAVNGVGDVVLTHDPAAEVAGVATGVLFNRRAVMYNDFLVVGPKAGTKTGFGTIVDDPAGVRNGTTPNPSATDAFTHIWDYGQANMGPSSGLMWFYSRGDRSGTHAKEGLMWAAIGHGASIWKHDPPGVPAMSVPFPNTGTPATSWYTWAGTGSGAGMASTLGTANTNKAYTLVDRGTWEFTKGAYSSMLVVSEGDPLLNNPYSVLESYKSTNPDGAGLFADWLCSAEGQAAIAAYGRYTFGRALFIPNAN